MTGKVIGFAMVMIGEVKCLSAPKELRGFVFVGFSILFFGIGAIINVLIGYFPQLMNRGLIASLESIYFLMSLVASVLLLTFLNRLHMFLGNAKLYHKSLKLRRDISQMISFGVSLFVVAAIFMAIGGGRANPLIILVGFAALALLLYFYSWVGRFNKLAHESTAAIPV